MVTQNGQIYLSKPFLQPIPKQRCQPAIHHSTLCLEDIWIPNLLIYNSKTMIHVIYVQEVTNSGTSGLEACGKQGGHVLIHIEYADPISEVHLYGKNIFAQNNQGFQRFQRFHCI